MTEVFNLLDGELDEGEERDGFRHRRAVIGRRLGAELLGATVYEVPPGERLWPYHWELGCEEFLVVVAGRPTLRSPAGERELAPGDVVDFPEGNSGTHQVVNRSGESIRVLLGSTKAPVAIAGYPDSGKVMIWARDHDAKMLRDEPVDYWDGEH